MHGLSVGEAVTVLGLLAAARWRLGRERAGRNSSALAVAAKRDSCAAHPSHYHQARTISKGVRNRPDFP